MGQTGGWFRAGWGSSALLLAACAGACAVLAAGEVVVGREVSKLLLSDDLVYRLAEEFGRPPWVPSCCLLGIGVWLLRGTRGRRNTSHAGEMSTRVPPQVKERREEPTRPQPTRPVATKKPNSQRSHRTCFLCGFLEECMEPAANVQPASLGVASSAAGSKESSSHSCAAARELRDRLSDLLGPQQDGESSSLAEADSTAAGTIACFGGEQSCFHRFLHAKRHRVLETEGKLRRTIEWRRQVGANNIQEDLEAQKIWDLMEPVWPEKVLGTTRDGSPITYFDLSRAIKTCQMDLWTESNVQKFYVAWMERSLLNQREGRERHGPCGDGNNMPATVVVYNLKDLRLSHILRCVKGLAAFVKILGVIDEHYPENLRKGVIINVPCIFYKMIWPLVQKALDERTLQNLRLTDGEDRGMLAEALGVGCDEVDTMLNGVLR